MADNKNTKNPWNSLKWRLSAKIGSPYGFKENGKEAISWAVLKLKNTILDEGERVIADPDRPKPTAISHSEFAHLRQDCGLSQTEAARFLGMNDSRTIRYWENVTKPDRAVPPKAAMELLYLRQKLEISANEAVELAFEKKRQSDAVMDNTITLYTYNCESYKSSKASNDGLPFGSHQRLLNLTREKLEDAGFKVEFDVAN